MKEWIALALDGFVGSFVLAGTLVTASTTGLWRGTSRLYAAFARRA
jgi:hypothetical protein